MVWPPASIKHLTLHYSGHCSYGQSHLVYVLIVCHPGKGAVGWLGDRSWAVEGVTRQNGQPRTQTSSLPSKLGSGRPF